ncbi:hypothetical protein KY334_01930 [Candidatus Woesearchaeota archaeon]|nr:hypothetical protein [Candidatus Woesearchaeota archaeon]
MAKHPKHVVEYNGSLEELAKDVGNLTYDKLTEFLEYLQENLRNQSGNDLKSGRSYLASQLYCAADDLTNVISNIEEAWNISRPYMKRAVKGVVYNQDKVLLERPLDENKKYSRWRVPNGILRDDEEDIDGLKRIIFEKSNIEIEVKRYLDFHYLEDGTLVSWYECEAINNDIENKIKDKEIKWIPTLGVLNYCCDNAKERWPKGVINYFIKIDQ